MLHKEDVLDLYSSPSIIRIVKLKRSDTQWEWGRRWPGVGERMAESGGEDGRVQIIGRKARGKETTGKTKT
jgi:hypothetical protein